MQQCQETERHNNLTDHTAHGKCYFPMRSFYVGMYREGAAPFHCFECARKPAKNRHCGWVVDAMWSNFFLLISLLWCIVVLKVVESGGKCHEVEKRWRRMSDHWKETDFFHDTEVGEAICLWAHTNTGWMPRDGLSFRRSSVKVWENPL